MAIVGGVLFLLCHEYLTSIDGFIIRKAAKDHGDKKLIEISTDKPNLNVVIIEDVTTTGQSTLRAIKILKEAGHNPVLIISVVDRGAEASQEFAKLGIPFHSLINAKDIVDKAISDYKFGESND